MHHKHNKYMQLMEIQSIKNRIVSKIETGDYITLSKVLGVKRNTAVSRFIRNKKNAVLIMSDIIEEREKTISKLRKKYLTHSDKLYTHEKTITE